MDCKISLGIVTYNSQDKIGNAVSSIKTHTNGVDYKLFVFDNGSTDDTKAIVLKADPDAEFISTGENLGFGKAHNLAIPLIDSKYHAIVNPDIILDSDVLSQMVEYMEANPDVALAIPKVLFPDKSEQKLPKLKPKLIYLLARRTPFFRAKAQEYTMENIKIDCPLEIDQCTGCFMLIRTDVFKALGGFDERFFMYMEDADLTLRTKKYGKTMYLPHISVIHEWERSSAKSLKYLMIHLSSCFKFLIKHRKKKESEK